MTGWLLRRLWRLAARRLGWMAVATIARAALRRGVADRVDEAASQLEGRLPVRVRSAMRHAPGDPVRLGGQAVVAGRSAGRVASTAASGAGRTGWRLRHRLAADGPRRRFGEEVRAETERSRRQLRSSMLRHLVGDAAADDALLDLRPSAEADRPRPELPAPVPTGRWRASRRSEPPVPRVKRTYRPPRRPWDG